MVTTERRNEYRLMDLYKRQAIAARRRCDIAFEVSSAVTRPRRPAFDEVHLRVAKKARRYGVVCCRVRGGPMPIAHKTGNPHSDG